MTSIDFLVSKIASKIDDRYYSNQQDITEYIEQANKMFEQQIIDAVNIDKRQYDNAKQYYISTYGSKGSDVTSSQTEHNSPKVENKDSFGEISDEEIEKVSNTLGDDYYVSELIMWDKGAKWYREQLKSKGNGETK